MDRKTAAKDRKRSANGKFVKKYDMIEQQRPDLGTGVIYSTAANSPWIAMPENVVAPLPPNPAIAPMAPGVYHINAYRSISASPFGLYRNLDEALRNCPITAKAMLNDALITGPLFQRWSALASYNDAVLPEDETDEDQVRICEDLEAELKNIPNWTEYKKNLMWAAWYGKHLNINNYEFSYKKNQRKLVVKDWQPLIGDKLTFRNNGRMGYLAMMPTGYREVLYSDHGLCELFNEDDRDCLVHHKYMITDTTWDESMLAIGIEGFGYRHWLYWTYWLKQQLLEWSMNAFQIIGAMGLRIGYFEQSNPESEAAVAAALSASNGSNIVLFPRPIGDEKQGAGLEIIGPNGIDMGFFQAFIENYFGQQIKQMLLGFDFDTKREDYTMLQRYDAAGLSETITRDLLSVLVKYNHPEAIDWDLKYKISVPDPDTNHAMEGIQRMYEIGLPLSQTECYDRLGFTMPTRNKKILKKVEGLGDNTMRTPNKNVGELGGGHMGGAGNPEVGMQRVEKGTTTTAPEFSHGLSNSTT